MNKIIIFIFSILLLGACNNSSDPINYGAIGTIKSSRTIYLDEDSIVHVRQDFPSGYNTGDRVIIHFNILETPSENVEIEVLDIRKILISNIVPLIENDSKTFQDTIIKVDRMWLSKGYITADYTYAAHDTVKTPHKFQLTKFETENKSLDTIILHFRHDTQKDSSSYRIRELLSFDISDLKPLSKDTVLLIIKTKLSPTSSDTKKFFITDSLVSFTD